MSATFIDSAALPREDGAQPPPPTVDLDLTGTTDVHEEGTADLKGDTADLNADLNGVAGAGASAREPAASAEASSPSPAAASDPAPQPKPMPKPMSRPVIAAGAILCDRFILERPIGQGGTAVVYRARDIRRMDSGDASIAIKIPTPGNKSRARAAARLRHEFERAKPLVHPNIVRVFELHQLAPDDAESCFMTMELIEGKLLSTILKERSATPVSLAYKILRACARALSYAHQQQIVHGDFKPSNVFVTPDADVKVVDFGASAASDDDPTRIPAATPAYASPEVLSGQTPDRRDDIFSFACVAYELLTGAHPFDRKTSIEAREAGWVPQRAWNLSTSQWLALLSALSWQREQRPDSIDAFIDKLTDEFSDVMIPDGHALHEPPAEPEGELPAEFMPRSRGWGFAAFAAAALTLVFVAAQRPEDDPAAAAPAPKASPASSIMAVPLPSTLSSSSAIDSSTDSSISSPPPASAPATKPVEEPATPEKTEPVSKPKASSAPASEVSFDAESIVTSESSIAAVFVVKRKGSLRGRATVSWQARAGTAEPGQDFLAESGTIEFADGQATRAIYVPLRNDQEPEDDETFSVVLHSPQGVRLGAAARVEATILDDD
jgi:serine/threonine protein kinase